jgi:hypothetical protein
MQKHIPYMVVTPRTLAAFKGSALILPNVRVLDESERESLRAFTKAGGKLAITGVDATGLSSQANTTRFADCPGEAYLLALQDNFTGTVPSSQSTFLGSLPDNPEISIEASPQVATHIARVAGNLHVFIANFKGLRGGENARQEPEMGVRITVLAGGRAKFLPFLGEEQELQGKKTGNAQTYTLPPIFRGAVFWIEPPR